uniref:uncharacterized protein n=1 Tax=Centroberyx gerrardi TaxID=166262 RepID=UPI003AB021F6
KWDASLKVIAEGYAAKCIWNHNPDLEETGENLFAGTGPLDLRMALEKWFLEHLDYEYHNNSCPEDKMCGHYTQMVWADTHRVGCAFHVCNTMEGLDFERASFLVCNYYPAGNYEGEKPYEEGDWCSRCPDNLQKCENNLCVADTVEEEDEEDDDEGGEEGEEGTVVPPPETADPFLDPTTTTTTSSSQDSDDTPHPATPASGTQPPDVPEPTQGEEEVQEEEEEKKIEGKEEQEKEKKKEEEEEQEKEKKGEEQEKKKEEKEEEKEKKKEEKKEAEQEKEKKKEEEQEQEKKKEEKKEEEQEKGKENIDDKKEREREREIERERERDRISMASAVCSVLSPSLLLACLTGILILRL